MTNIIEIEDVIPQALQNTIEEILLGSNFPVYLNSKTVSYVKDGDNSNLYWDKNTKDAAQFTHAIVRDGVQTSDYWSVLRPILYFLIAKTNKELIVERCKININVPNFSFDEQQYFPPHKDPAQDGWYVGIYYVNNSDGDTLFFETPTENNIQDSFNIVNRVVPKKGKMVFFPANIVHCATPPKKNDVRCVINFIFKVENA